jgi:hypothetical protein
MNELNLGETEVFEVWFFPTNRENYSVCILQAYETLLRAREYCDAMKPTMYGTMEIVRVRTIRQLMEASA